MGRGRADCPPPEVRSRQVYSAGYTLVASGELLPELMARGNILFLLNDAKLYSRHAGERQARVW